jgi:hypothetical protein
VETMGASSGSNRSSQWKRWEPLAEAIGAPSGNDGSAQWILMGASNGKRNRILPATRPVFSGGGQVAYVVYVVFNVFVCMTGRKDFGEHSRP